MQNNNHARCSVKLINTFDMKQKTTAPERVTPCTSSLIDHVYVSDVYRNNIMCLFFIDLSFSNKPERGEQGADRVCIVYRFTV